MQLSFDSYLMRWRVELDRPVCCFGLLGVVESIYPHERSIVRVCLLNKSIIDVFADECRAP